MHEVIRGDAHALAVHTKGSKYTVAKWKAGSKRVHDKCVSKIVDGWMDGWMNGWVDACMHGWIDVGTAGLI